MKNFKGSKAGFFQKRVKSSDSQRNLPSIFPSISRLQIDRDFHSPAVNLKSYSRIQSKETLKKKIIILYAR